MIDYHNLMNEKIGYSASDSNVSGVKTYFQEKNISINDIMNSENFRFFVDEMNLEKRIGRGLDDISKIKYTKEVLEEYLTFLIKSIDYDNNTISKNKEEPPTKRPRVAISMYHEQAERGNVLQAIVYLTSIITVQENKSKELMNSTKKIE